MLPQVNNAAFSKRHGKIVAAVLRESSTRGVSRRLCVDARQHPALQSRA
jgi:hypothetical protein